MSNPTAHVRTAHDAAMIADLKALPKLPEIVAASVLYAQGYKATPEVRAAISAHLGWARTYGFPMEARLRIVSPSGALLGYLTFPR